MLIVRPKHATHVHFRSPTTSDESHRRLVAVSDRRWVEQLMIMGARFSGAEFERLFLTQRFEIAQQLLWAAYDRHTGRARYFVVDDSVDVSITSTEVVGIPYVTELAAMTRAAAGRLLRAPYIDQLGRPVLLPAEPTGTVTDLSVLEDESLWGVGSMAALVEAGFGPCSPRRLERCYHHGNRAVTFILDRRIGRGVTVSTSAAPGPLPLPVLNELLLDIARVLVPEQTGGCPHLSRVHAGTLCTLCGDSIDEGEDAFVYQRSADPRHRYAALHRSCQPFSLAARFFGQAI